MQHNSRAQRKPHPAMVGVIRLPVAAALLCLCLVSGCASVSHTAITPENENSDCGIRYYETSAYLLIYPQPGGQCVATIKHLPDPTRKRSAHLSACGTRLKTTMAFQNGCLSATSDDPDAAIVPQAMLDAVQGVLPLLAALNVPAGETQLPAPSVYKFVTDDTGRVRLVGTAGTNRVSISLAETERRAP